VTTLLMLVVEARRCGNSEDILDSITTGYLLTIFTAVKTSYLDHTSHHLKEGSVPRFQLAS